MEDVFDFWRATRKNILGSISEFSIDQLNEIPNNYNNNLAWHFGHVLVTQQLLCYSLSGKEPLIDKTYILKYRKGTRPESFISEEEIQDLKSFNELILDQMPQAFVDGKFDTFKPYSTSYGVELSSIEQAIQFNNLHEALHLGYIMSIRKLV